MIMERSQCQGIVLQVISADARTLLQFGQKTETFEKTRIVFPIFNPISMGAPIRPVRKPPSPSFDNSKTNITKK